MARSAGKATMPVRTAVPPATPMRPAASEPPPSQARVVLEAAAPDSEAIAVPVDAVPAAERATNTPAAVPEPGPSPAPAPAALSVTVFRMLTSVCPLSPLISPSRDPAVPLVAPASWVPSSCRQSTLAAVSRNGRMNALRARSSVRSELRIWNVTRSVSRFDDAMIWARLASFSM